MAVETATPGCRFCLANGLLDDTPLIEDEHFFVLGSIDPDMPQSAMVVPRRHSETPFDFTPEEWPAFGDMLNRARDLLAPHAPDGFTLGWNVGAVAGQHVFHAHLHIIPRFKDGPNAGAGIRRVLRTPDWDQP